MAKKEIGSIENYDSLILHNGNIFEIAFLFWEMCKPYKCYNENQPNSFDMQGAD